MSPNLSKYSWQIKLKEVYITFTLLSMPNNFAAAQIVSNKMIQQSINSIKSCRM